MPQKKNKNEVDAIVAYLFIKAIMQPITSMDAFKLGLIDNLGRLKRQPQNQVEEDSLTLLDMIAIKVKRLLGTRVQELYNFLYLQTLSNNMYNNIIVMPNFSQKAEIKRVMKDLKRIIG